MNDETCSGVESRTRDGCKAITEEDFKAVIARLNDAQPPRYGAVAISIDDRDALLAYVAAQAARIAELEIWEEVAHGRAIAIDMGDDEEAKLHARITALERALAEHACDCGDNCKVQGIYDDSRDFPRIPGEAEKIANCSRRRARSILTANHIADAGEMVETPEAMFRRVLEQEPAAPKDSIGRRLVSSTEFQEADWEVAATMVDDAIAAERQRLAAEIEAGAMERPPSGARIGMAIAARIVRRGRRLTAAEQMANLSNALAESDDDKRSS